MNSHELMKTLGDKVRFYRQRERPTLNMVEFCYRFNIQHRTYQRIENGKRIPSTDIFDSVMIALQISPDEEKEVYRVYHTARHIQETEKSTQKYVESVWTFLSHTQSNVSK